MNINRDFLIVLDVKSGEVDSPNIYYFNTDKNTSNLYVQMVIKETSIEAAPIDNATNYSIKANILKPNMVGKIVEGDLVNEAKAIYEFKLPADCTDFSGNAKIEFEVYTGDKIATSFATKFKVHGSVLTEQNKYIEDSSDYPILKELMAEVKVINETAHELDTTIRTLQSDMIEANNEMKANESERQSNEVSRQTNESNRITAEETRARNEVLRETNEDTRIANEQRRIANEDERKVAENQRKANEFERRTNEVERKSAEASRVSAENTRVANEEERQTNEANRETAEEIRKANEQARIAEHEAMRTEHEQTMTAVNEVKAENAILMENDKKIADRMTQVEISDKRQYVIMEGLMNSAGDGYLKIEDTGNDTTLYNSVEGFVDVKNVTGNTMVNSIKNPDDELTLNADINTSGQSVTLTTAVDNGQVDVLAEGNTMVNVCDQQEAVAITKSYTVETGNHVALQGEFDGKARPVVHGNTLVNLITLDVREKEITTSPIVDSTYAYLYQLKPNTTYTLFYTLKDIVLPTTGDVRGVHVSVDAGWMVQGEVRQDDGDYKFVFTTTDNTARNTSMMVFFANGTRGGSGKISNVILLEGDYTNKPIPDYFTGMQSSFEDKLVTQEMVDSGEELAENLGKYRVDYKVTGKNKINARNLNIISTSNTICEMLSDGGIKVTSTKDVSDGGVSYARLGDIKIPKNKTHIINFNGGENSSTCYIWVNKNGSTNKVDLSTSSNEDRYIHIGLYVKNGYSSVFYPQLEEGTVATAYEPYKEFTKTYYLNSPLLEGDTIEESNGNVYHVHRYGKVVLDGSDTSSIWASATYTDDKKRWVLMQNNTIANIGVNDITTFNDKYSNTTPGNTYMCKEGICQNTGSNCIYLYLDKYSDGSDESKQLLVNELRSNPVNVVYELASPQYELISQSDTILTDSYVAGHLDFDTAVPVEKVTFRHFGIEMKYVYPSTSYNIQFEADNVGKLDGIYLSDGSLTDVNIVKGINKLTITTPATLIHNFLDIMGIGFNMSNIVVTEATDKDFGYFSGMKSVGELEGNTIEIVSANGTDSTAEGYLSNSKQIILNEPLRSVGDVKDRFVQIDGKWYVERNCAERNYETDDETNTSYKTDKVKTVYALTSPTYEPVEIAPTVNTYTDVTHITNNSTIPMNMNIKNSGYEIIAKPNTKYTVVGITNGRIGDSTIVNGTITTPATLDDPFLRPYGTGKTSKVMLLEGEPANIPGYFTGIKSVFEDKVTEDGKYACEVRVYNDLGEETVQTLYLDEPLYNTNNITIYNDKLGYWKNYDIRDYQDGDFGTYLTDMTKTVYQLAEPVFVPLIDNCPNWVIGSWDNCSIHFDSIIPLKDTRYRYTGNVPSVMAMRDDVAEAKSISDEQDLLLVDMATELAVMKLTM